MSQAKRGGHRTTPRAETAVEVCLTVDVEFSIGGAFADPEGKRPVGAQAVWCRADGEEHGLTFLLDTLRRHGLRATFFVEALNVFHFGPDEMGRIARHIRAAGHDVQLHLHPCWLHFRRPDWRAALADGPPDDSCSGRSGGDLAGMLEAGLAAFRAWGLPPPAALRTGSLRVDRGVYAAMARHGLVCSSSVGLAYWRPAEPALRLHSGRHWRDGILEVPVATYRGWGGHRLLTVAGTAAAELRALLREAWRRRVPTVTILTHPFEFVKRGDDQYRRVIGSRINKSRFAALCRFLDAERRNFRTVTFAEAMPGWLHGEDTADALLSAPLAPGLLRMVENGLNDRIWRF